MRSPVGDLLADLASALAQAGVEWYLFGAQAAILYGAARLTADVDVTVRLGESGRHASLTTAVERFGFSTRISDLEFIERTGVLTFAHTATGLPVDIVVAGPGLEDQFFSRVVLTNVEGVAVPIASPEDIVVMKILAGRPKDLEDVAAIAASLPSLDLPYTQRTLRVLEEALAQRDLLPMLDQIVERARRR